MADDKSNLTETKQAHHAELANEHKRLAEFHETHAGGLSSNAGSTPSLGSQTGDFMSAIMSHKWLIIGGIVLAIVLFTVILPSMNSANNANNTANQSPNYALASGVVPSSLQASIDNINAQLSSLVQPPAGPAGPQGPPGTNGTNGTNGSSGTGFMLCPLGLSFNSQNGSCGPTPILRTNPPVNTQNPSPSVFVTAGRFPGPNGTLSGIAQSSGITLSRIENLNPQIKNPNKIFAGEKIRVK